MLRSVRETKTHLTVATSRNEVTLPLIWFRDHCQCPQCYHEDTKQRLLNTVGLPEELEIDQLRISADMKKLIIVWLHDTHCSEYAAELFMDLRYNPENLGINHTLWNARTFAEPPHFYYEDFMQSDLALLDFLEFVEEYGFCFVEGTPPTQEGTTAVTKRLGYLRDSVFGSYIEMTANLEHKDTAYTSLSIGPHTDGTYSNDAPSYQVLHVHEEECEGAMNILVDGFKIADVMKRNYRSEYDILTSVQIPGQYIDTVKGTHLMARRPLLRLDDRLNLVQVSYNNHDRAPFLLEPEAMTDFYCALKTWSRLTEDPDFHFRRKLLPGSCLFFDNWRVLHARESYVGYRKLAGTYLNKEDVESKLRVLRSRKG